MGRFLRTALAAAFLLAALSAPAAAERVFTVNGAAGAFDQPSATVEGTRVHAAFIGGSAKSGPFLVYYALLDGSQDFTKSTLTRADVLLAPPLAVVDNVGTSTAGDNVYVDARHPRIAFRSSTSIVIFFQGRPAALSDPFVLYRARLTLSGNAVTSVSVRKIKEGARDVPGTDVAVVLDTVDESARLAYAVPPASWGGTFLSTVRYARIGLENAAVVDNSLLLSSGNDNAVLGSDGFQPLPTIALDSSRRAHVAWSSAPDSGTTPASIFYAMVKAGTTGASGKDNVVIGATSVFEGARKWAFPAIAAAATNSIYILATDAAVPGIAGNINWVLLNPDADNQDGTPVENVAFNQFRTQGPGGTPYAIYRPEILYDATGSSPVFILTGYGAGGTTGSNYVLSINPVSLGGSPLSPLSSYPEGVATTFASLDNDYTRGSCGFLSGRAMVFWSGWSLADPSDGSVRNLFVSIIPSGTRPPNPTKQSGCGMTAFPHDAGASDAAGVALLFLPALLLGARRISRSRRLRPAAVGP